jgi:hypothetical protein
MRHPPTASAFLRAPSLAYAGGLFSPPTYNSRAPLRTKFSTVARENLATLDDAVDDHAIDNGLSRTRLTERAAARATPAFAMRSCSVTFSPTSTLTVLASLRDRGVSRAPLRLRRLTEAPRMVAHRSDQRPRLGLHVARHT